MRKYRSSCFTLILIILLVMSNINVALATQPPFDIQAKSAILMDYETGTILYEKNPQENCQLQVWPEMTILLALKLSMKRK